jgi:hypothetical protein
MTPRSGYSSVVRRRSTRRALAFGCHLLAAAASAVMGVWYLGSSQFQGYHGDAAGAEWEQLDVGVQVLVRALMNVAGGGWLAAAVAVAWLLAVPWRRGERWAEWAVPTVGLAAWAPTTWATIEVTARTEAIAPWYGAFAVAALSVVGAALSATAHRRVRPTAPTRDGTGPPVTGPR